MKRFSFLWVILLLSGCQGQAYKVYYHEDEEKKVTDLAPATELPSVPYDSDWRFFTESRETFRFPSKKPDLGYGLMTGAGGYYYETNADKGKAYALLRRILLGSPIYSCMDAQTCIPSEEDSEEPAAHYLYPGFHFSWSDGVFLFLQNCYSTKEGTFVADLRQRDILVPKKDSGSMHYRIRCNNEYLTRQFQSEIQDFAEKRSSDVYEGFSPGYLRSPVVRPAF